MTKHRSPQDRVSNDVHPDNSDDTDNPDTPDDPDDSDDSDDSADPDAFDPADPNTFDPAEALRSLHLEVVQLEALAHAASEAVVNLPFPKGREARRPFDRVYALVTKVADETRAVVSYGGKLMDALGGDLQRR